MQALLVKQHRNAEPRAAGKTLDRVDQLDRLAHVPVRSLERIAGPLQVAGPRKLADAVRVQAARRRRIEPSVALEQLVLLRPDRRELRDLLVLRHACQEVLHTLLDGGRGVAIKRALLSVQGGRREQRDRQQAQVLHRYSP